MSTLSKFELLVFESVVICCLIRSDQGDADFSEVFASILQDMYRTMDSSYRKVLVCLSPLQESLL